MKRFFIFIMMIVAALSYAQDDTSEIPESVMMKHMVSIDGGALLTMSNTVMGRIINVGYENLLVPNFGVQVSFNVWFLNVWYLNATKIGATSGINVHFIANSSVDPYLGIGVCYLTYASYPYNVASIYIPVVLGLNMMFDRSFGLRFQGKTFLLSLASPLFEINFGFVVAFETRS